MDPPYPLLEVSREKGYGRSRAHNPQPIGTHQHEFVAIPLASRLCKCLFGVVMLYRICPPWPANQREAQPDPYAQAFVGVSLSLFFLLFPPGRL